jgi:hypothetical protein
MGALPADELPADELPADELPADELPAALARPSGLAIGRSVQSVERVPEAWARRALAEALAPPAPALQARPPIRSNSCWTKPVSVWRAVRFAAGPAGQGAAPGAAGRIRPPAGLPVQRLAGSNYRRDLDRACRGRFQGLLRKEPGKNRDSSGLVSPITIRS